MTATRYSKARYARAARVLAPITLAEPEAQALAEIQERTGENAAALVRRLLREEARRQRRAR
jgi:hypothetical protein